MIGRRTTSAILFALVVLAPLGTRFIWRTGSIAGVGVEPGTISLFGTQLLAAMYALAVLFAAGGAAFIREVRRPPALLAIGLSLIGAVSVSQSGDRGYSLLAVSWVALGAALFIALLVDRPGQTVFFRGAVAGAVLQAGLGSWQFFSQSAPAFKWLGMAEHQAASSGVFVIENAAGRWLRAYGTFGHPNVYGFFIVIGVLACLGLIAVRSARSREPWLALLPVLAAGLFCSFSKSAVVALAAGLMLYLLLTARERRIGPGSSVWAVALPLLAVFLIIGAIYSGPAWTRVAGQGRLELRSWNERQSLTVDALKLVSGHAALGVGIGEMPAAVWRELADGRSGWDYQNVHNLPLLVLVDTGVVGLLLWLAFIGAIGRSLWISLRSGSGKVAVPAAMFLAVLTVGMFDHFLWSSWTGQLLFWLVCGLAAVSARGAGHAGSEAKN